MARTRNDDKYSGNKESLIAAGEALIRKASYSQIGINDVLRETGIPKGSFYHYFDSKLEFGIAVSEFYHQKQMETARKTLKNQHLAPINRLQGFFESALQDMKTKQFTQGCLMCNLTTELADENNELKNVLNRQWQELSNEIADCLKAIELKSLNLEHLSRTEAADWLLNSWSGALTRMKSSGSAQPLHLFLKSLHLQSTINH
ncbi:TetR/AcrR family transcriptional regulator [Sessilibacter sp. MAH4]